MANKKRYYDIPVGFGCYEVGGHTYAVPFKSCFYCRHCLIGYDNTNGIRIIQCKHPTQWKNDEDKTDKGMLGKCKEFKGV